jgi:hypothetical protein
MASRGCEIVATDAPTENAVTAGWAGGEEYADGLASLNLRGICEDQAFRARVSFRNVDMNHIPTDLRGFDFCWSSCALEHLGSIEHGLAYIEASLECLVPGGIASHTTEFNLTSNDDTVAQGHTVLFRRRDIEGLVVRLRERGHRIELNLHPGAGPLDEYVDLPPYQQDPHVKLLIRQYVTTSIGLVIQKAS